MEKIVAAVISILCFVNTALAVEILTEDKFVDKIANKYGKTIIVDYIMDHNSGVITIEHNGVIKEYIGRPSGEYVNGKTILADIRKMGVDILDFESDIDRQSKETAKTIGGHHWKRENGILVVQQTKRELKPVSFDKPKTEAKTESNAGAKKSPVLDAFGRPRSVGESGLPQPLGVEPRPSLKGIKIPENEEQAKVVRGFIALVREMEVGRTEELSADEYRAVEKNYFSKFSKLSDGTVVKRESDGAFSNTDKARIESDYRARLAKLIPAVKELETAMKYYKPDFSGLSQEKAIAPKLSKAGDYVYIKLSGYVQIDPDLKKEWDDNVNKYMAAKRLVENAVETKAQKEATETKKDLWTIKKRMFSEMYGYK